MKNIRWEMRRPPDGIPPEFADEEVWVDIEKLDQQWSATADTYIAPGGNGAPKYQAVAAWIAGDSLTIFMPWVTINEGVVEFSDGRHRFACLRDAGLKTMPIAVPKDCAADMRAKCGVEQPVGREQSGAS